ncbi:MAG TPA: hypothetical protein VLM80_02940 [Anaerolineales bacterium]|nr:hypothetical protein [Anaerolineales bacterium]
MTMSSVGINSNEPNHTSPKWMLWFALFVSGITALVWFIDMVVILLCDLLFGCVVLTWEAALHVFLVSCSAATVIWAWKKPFAGGLIMLLWGVALSIFAYLTSYPYQFISTLATGVPFTIAGALFILYGVTNSRNL